jgi:hypothetical protein
LSPAELSHLDIKNTEIPKLKVGSNILSRNLTPSSSNLNRRTEDLKKTLLKKFWDGVDKQLQPLSCIRWNTG